MDYNDMYDIIKQLPFDMYETVYEDEKNEIRLYRPVKRFKNYDLAKNFQIYIKEGERSFRPNHLRVMIDLHLRGRCRPDLKTDLLRAFDAIFYKNNPDIVLKELSKETFEHSLNNIKLIGCLSQIFIIEQEYNYNSPSKYDPVSLFYQGWLRQSIDNSSEIDNLVMSICSRRPPNVKYTSADNKKHKKYSAENKPLWYL